MLKYHNFSLEMICRIFSMLFFLFVFLSCQKNDPDGLKKLEELRENYLSKSNSEIELYHINDLKEEAIKQNNPRYIAMAYYYLSHYYSMSQHASNKDSSYYAANKALEYYEKSDYRMGKVLAQLQIIELLTLEGSFQLALDKAFELVSNTKISSDPEIMLLICYKLTNIYFYSDNLNEALVTIDRFTDIYGKTENKKKWLSEYNNMLYMKAVISNLSGRYEESLLYCKNFIETLNKDESISESVREEINQVVNSTLALNYIHLGELDKAQKCINEIDVFLSEQKNIIPGLLLDFYFVNSSYYLKIQDYDKAIHYLELKDDDKIYSYQDYVSTKQLKIDILTAKGDTVKALKEKNALLEFTNSEFKKRASQQIERLNTTYRLKQQTVANEIKMKYIRVVILLLSVICISLIITFFIKRHDIRKLRRKNQLIFSKYRDIDKITDKIELDIPSNIQNKEKQNKEINLFDKTERYLNETKYFLKHDLSRESLAAELGTNRQYLTDAIQENRGMTFMEYINEKRLEYARRLLSYNVDMSIDEVYLSSGFNSKSTFYRLFKQKYDLTPKELREIAFNR